MIHPLYKLGKQKAKRDGRNFHLRALMAPKVVVPAEYSFDTAHPGIPLPMFGNDQYGDCVIAARGHQTLRFEYAETKSVLSISDKDVLNEYFSETGGSDDGLNLLDSLNEWRTNGWKVGKKKYTIKLFAEINRKSVDEVKQVVFANIGANIGLNLPLSAQKEIDAGKPWATTTGKGSTAGSWGGHCVFVVGYTTKGPVCITWGQRQQMTWAWFAKYCDEAYSVIDATDTVKKSNLLNEKAVAEHLARVA